MGLLTKAAILKADDLKHEDVAVPEWGGELRIRTMTATERDAWETGVYGDGKKPNLANLRARLVALCAVDGEGSRLFTDKEAEALGRKSAAAMDRVFAVAQRLNGLSAGDVEQLTKN